MIGLNLQKNSADLECRNRASYQASHSIIKRVGEKKKSHTQNNLFLKVLFSPGNQHLFIQRARHSAQHCHRDVPQIERRTETYISLFIFPLFSCSFSQVSLLYALTTALRQLLIPQPSARSPWSVWFPPIVGVLYMSVLGVTKEDSQDNSCSFPITTMSPYQNLSNFNQKLINSFNVFQDIFWSPEITVMYGTIYILWLEIQASLWHELI